MFLTYYRFFFKCPRLVVVLLLLLLVQVDYQFLVVFLKAFLSSLVSQLYPASFLRFQIILVSLAYFILLLYFKLSSMDEVLYLTPELQHYIDISNEIGHALVNDIFKRMYIHKQTFEE